MITQGNDNKFQMFNLDADEFKIQDDILLIIGYYSYTFLANSLVHIFIIFIYLALDLIVGQIGKKVKTNKVIKFRNKYLHNRFLISIYLSFSIQLNYSILLQAFNFSFETFYTGLNSVLSIIGLVIFQMQVFQIVVILHFFQIVLKFVKLQKQVKDSQMKDQAIEDQQQIQLLENKYFPLFDELKKSHANTLIFYPLFLVRRFLLALVLIGVRENSLVQIILVTLVNIAQVVYVIVCKPFMKRVMNTTHIVLEIWFVCLNILNFYFYTQDDKNEIERIDKVNSDKSKLVGFIVVLVSNIVTLLGIVICLYCLIKDVIKKAKEKKQKQSQKKQEQDSKTFPMEKINKSFLITVQESFQNQNYKDQNSTLRDLQLVGNKDQSQIEDSKMVSQIYIEEEVIAIKDFSNKNIQKGIKSDKVVKKKKSSNGQKNKKSQGKGRKSKKREKEDS